MTAEDLRAAYPGAADAVVLHETYIRIPKHLPPHEVLETLKRCADDTLAIEPVGPLTVVRPQMDHPDFLKYLRAKLGAM